MGFTVKKIIILSVIFTVFCGCSAYQATSFNFNQTGELLVEKPDGGYLPEQELIGKKCKIELENGSIHEGEIQSISPQNITLVRFLGDSSIEEPQAVTTSILKMDIDDLKIEWTQKSRSSGLAIIAFVAALPIIFAVMMMQSGGPWS